MSEVSNFGVNRFVRGLGSKAAPSDDLGPSGRDLLKASGFGVSGFRFQIPGCGFRLRSLPTDTKVESGTSQSKSGTSVYSNKSGFRVKVEGTSRDELGRGRRKLWARARHLQRRSEREQPKIF